MDTDYHILQYFFSNIFTNEVNRLLSVFINSRT